MNQSNDEIAELLGPSCLEIRKLRLDESRGSFTKTVFVAEVVSPNMLAEFKAFNDENATKKDSVITGIILIQENTAISYLEGDSQGSVNYLSALKDFAAIQNVRVVASNDDLPKRLINEGLFVKDVKLSNPIQLDLDTDKIGISCFLAYASMQKLATFLSETSLKNIDKTFQNSPKKLESFVPCIEAIQALCNCELIMSIDDFQQMYGNPLDFNVESERTWPIHPLVNY